jgi:hypothetical protein
MFQMFFEPDPGSAERALDPSMPSEAGGGSAP